MKKPLRALCWILLIVGLISSIVLVSQNDLRANFFYAFSLVLIVVLIIDSRKKKKEIKAQQIQYDAQIRLNHIDGIPNVIKDDPCILTVKDGVLHITQTINKFEAATLNLNQITNIGAFTESEIVEKSKHVVGRSIAGGMVFGPVGAIVGGISGTQKKQKNKVRLFLVINYVSSQNQDIKAITFENVNPFGGTQNFINYMNEHITRQAVSL